MGQRKIAASNLVGQCPGGQYKRYDSHSIITLHWLPLLCYASSALSTQYLPPFAPPPTTLTIRHDSLSEHSTLRSRERRNSDGLEGPVKSFPSGYELYIPLVFPFRPLIIIRTLKKSKRGIGAEGGTQRQADV